MSTFQGQCGYCDPSGCWPAPVFPGQTEQFGGSDSKEFRATATVYGHALLTQQKRFASATDYLRYKKGLIAAGSAGGYRPYRAPPAPIADMIAAGCPTAEVCAEVCPVSTGEPSTVWGGIPDISDTEFQDYLTAAYGVSLPSPPPGYPDTDFIAIVYTPYCNSTSQITNIYDESGNVLPAQITDLGPALSYEGGPFGPLGVGGTVIIYPLAGVPFIFTVTVTASNSCSSSTGSLFFCFLEGSPVTMADGSTKPIETVAVGDRVVGAFGEINTVTGSLSNLLGFVPITNINGEHKTTAPHPHITADHKFCCTDTDSLIKFAYGRRFPIRGADGKLEPRVIKGVSQERITKLEVGTVLQTQTGARTVATLETIRMPPSTRVYHLTTDGSHSYLVDGYAVAGGATEEDFDYDTWTPRS
jgi:hypothetical protein